LDVLVENFGPGTLDRMGLTWEYVHKTNPRMIVASVKGFGPALRRLQGLREHRPVRRRCGVHHRLPRRAAVGHRRPDRRFRHRPASAFGIVTALYQRMRTGRGQRVLCAMQDGVLNLARVKLRDQQRLAHGPLTEYGQHGEGIPFGKAVPRGGNDSGGGSRDGFSSAKAGRPSGRLHLFHHAGAGLGPICDLIGKPEWRPIRIMRPGSAAAAATTHLQYDRGMDKDQDQVRGHDICNQHDIRSARSCP